MKLLLRRSILIISVLLLTASSSLSLLLPSTAQAEDFGWGEDITAYDQAKRWFYYRGMRACLEGGFANEKLDPGISLADINKGQFDGGIDGKEAFGFVARNLDELDGQDGTVQCDDGSVWVGGAENFGFSSVLDMICAINRAMGPGDNNLIQPNGADCEKSTNVKFDNGGGSAWQEALTKALTDEGSGKRPSFDINGSDSGILLYIIGRESLLTFCGQKNDTKSFQDRLDNLTNDSKRVKVDVVDESTGVVDKGRNYVISGDRDESTKVSDVVYFTDSLRNIIGGNGNTNEGDDLTCAEMAKLTTRYSGEYAKYIKLHPDAEPTNPGGNNQNPTGNGETGTSCDIDSVGWIVCPVLSFMATMNDAALSFLGENFLKIGPEFFEHDQTQAAWGGFRDIANILFVIIFLFIIYSQMTGAGISNYGIKRMLPKLIIAAILVNASYILCQIAVDLSNIIGANISQFLATQLPTDTEGGTTYSGLGDLSWYKTATGALAVAGTAMLAIVLIGSAGFAGLLALAMIVVILVARKAIIILLVVTAPVAFVAYLLPNTEGIFKKWWGLFKAMLLLYPIIGMVFGASILAATIIAETSDGNVLLDITALAVTALPLFAVPFLLKGALGGLGSIGTKLSGGLDKANRNAMANMKKGRSGEALDAFKARRNLSRMNRRRGEGRLATWGSDDKRKDTRRGRAAAWIGTRQKALDESAAGRYLGGDRGAASAVAGIHKEFDDNVKAQKALLSGRSNDSLLQDLRDGKGSDEYQAAVAGTLMSRNHRESHLQALDIMRARNVQAESSGNRKAMDTVSSVQKQMSDDMRDKPWALGDQAAGQLVEGTYGLSKSHTGEAQTHFTDDIQQQLQDRVGKKLSAQSLATMNPDEMKRIHAAAISGSLTPDQLASLKTAIQNVRDNKQMSALVKPEAQEMFDSILPPTTP